MGEDKRLVDDSLQMKTRRGLVKKLREIIAGTRPVPAPAKPLPTPPPPARPAPLPPRPADAGVMEFDERSERNLRTLTPEAERQFRAWLRRVRAAGIPAVIICGTRTFAEQSALYAQGRTKPGPIVTRAKPGWSVHNYGMAIDFVVFESINTEGGTGQPLWGDPRMTHAGRIAIDMGLDWGGAWTTFKDVPHIQLSRLNLAELREQMPMGWTPA